MINFQSLKLLVPKAVKNNYLVVMGSPLIRENNHEVIGELFIIKEQSIGVMI